MPTGLRVPVGVNKAGGANIEDDEVEQTKKMLHLALSEGGDDNPFQSLGLKGDLVFSVRNNAFRGKALNFVTRVVSKFADRIALAPGEPITFSQDTENEVEMSLKYVDLSTSKIQDFVKKFAR